MNADSSARRKGAHDQTRTFLFDTPEQSWQNDGWWARAKREVRSDAGSLVAWKCRIEEVAKLPIASIRANCAISLLFPYQFALMPPCQSERRYWSGESSIVIMNAPKVCTSLACKSWTKLSFKSPSNFESAKFLTAVRSQSICSALRVLRIVESVFLYVARQVQQVSGYGLYMCFRNIRLRVILIQQMGHAGPSFSVYRWTLLPQPGLGTA